MAIGAFSTQPIDYRSRLIYTTPKAPAPAPTPRAPAPVDSPFPVSRLPVPRMPIPEPIIDYMIPTTKFVPASPPPSGGSGSGTGGDTGGTSGGGGGDTGGTSGGGGGSTGTSDFSRLIDMIGSSFEEKEVGGMMAPVSFGAENTGDAGAAESNPMVPIIIALIVIAGVYFYMKRKGKK